MQYINGVLMINIRKTDYTLSDKDEIMFNGDCWQIISKKNKHKEFPLISKNKIKNMLKNNWIEFKEKRLFTYSEVEIYKITKSIT